MPQRYPEDTVLSQVLRGENEVEGCNQAKHRARDFLQRILSKQSRLEMRIYLTVFANHDFFFPSRGICGVWRCFPMWEGF